MFDDRKATPGVKFADADLIGLPLRVTVSDRSLAKGGVELGRRDRTERTIVPEDELLATVRAELQRLQDDVESRVAPAKFPDS